MKILYWFLCGLFGGYTSYCGISLFTHPVKFSILLAIVMGMCVTFAIDILNERRKQLQADIADQTGWSNPVFCSNCRFYRYETLLMFHSFRPRNPHACECPSNLNMKNTPINISEVYEKFATDLNKNNNCKNYKRIWYKFWVK